MGDHRLNVNISLLCWPEKFTQDYAVKGDYQWAFIVEQRQ